ncbi:hypothetical protein E2C01_047333 [Portunus trituberculatus]|uniref:Uncharacterized protein n=1 Tax=Portunus trituberculatus TaxID=210409 RepID=A0A5B7G3B8_PORTR|nr:hypothetical protein [Portunus trituberculatus]
MGEPCKEVHLSAYPSLSHPATSLSSAPPPHTTPANTPTFPGTIPKARSVTPDSMQPLPATRHHHAPALCTSQRVSHSVI